MLQMHQNVQPVAAEPFPLGSTSQISKEQQEVGIALCPTSPKNKPWANEETKHGLKIHSRINRSHACRYTTVAKPFPIESTSSKARVANAKPHSGSSLTNTKTPMMLQICLLYTSDAADE